MTIKYCSWATGNDDTGDGSYSNPYKTIQKASTGLGAGDEVRVAKSPDNTNLSGTLAFTRGSTAVVGTETSFTTQLALGDFIKGGDGNWWEVVTITDDTHVTLYQKYSGENCSGVSSQKLGLTCTGAASGSTTTVQSVSASGSSSDFLYISGGWDLSTQIQTGVTNFQQLHGTFANRYGYGLNINNRNYLKIEKLNFLRYNYGIFLVGSSRNNIFNSSTCNSNAYAGIFAASGTSNNTFSSIICNANGSYGIYIGGSNNTLSSSTCNSNGNSGIYGTGTSNNTFSSSTCNSNTEYGIALVSSSHNNAFSSSTCNSNGSYGIYINASNNITLISATCNSNSYGIYLDTSYNVNIWGILNTSSNSSASIYTNVLPIYVNKANLSETTKIDATFLDYANYRFYINNIGGYSQIWTDGGNIVSQDATAGGSGIEWRFNVTSSNRSSFYPLSMEVARVAVQANKQVTVKLYFKKSSTGIAGDLFLRGGQIAGVDDDVKTTCPDNTNRNQVQIQFTPTEKGVVAIEARAWYVSSTTSYLIIDDIDISQAD